jgi:hypothetical protein
VVHVVVVSLAVGEDDNLIYSVHVSPSPSPSTHTHISHRLSTPFSLVSILLTLVIGVMSPLNFSVLDSSLNKHLR